MLTSVPTSLTEGPVYMAMCRSGSVCQSAEWGEPSLQQPTASIYSVESKHYWKWKSCIVNALCSGQVKSTKIQKNITLRLVFLWVFYILYNGCQICLWKLSKNKKIIS